MALALLPLVMLSVTFNALAQIALRKAMLAAGTLPPLGRPVALGLALAGNPWLWAGLASFGLSIALWLAVLARVEVSTAYPMASLGYVVAALIGILFLGETVTAAHWGGIALICLGVLVVARTG